MRKRYIAAIIAVALILLISLIVAIRRHRSRRIDPADFGARWKALQKNCASRKTWPDAICEADDLLAEALKKAGFKGKTTGERLVAAQHVLTMNEQVWLGHKLRGRIVGQDVRTIKKVDVFEALSGFRQALRDLEALK
ncbi:MAG TPA: hypothetical protein VF401_04175 [Candidatus Saccharimonadales bacterium]